MHGFPLPGPKVMELLTSSHQKDNHKEHLQRQIERFHLGKYPISLVITSIITSPLPLSP